MRINGSLCEAMATQVYTVLYTHQKTKKAKVWQDGILKTSGGQQAALYSDKGQRLDSVYVKTGVVNPGDELESDRYLITVEALGDSNSSTNSSTEKKDVQNFNRGALKPIGLRPPAGLKRKFTGFQGPREIAKKPPLQVEETASVPCTSQSPQLHTTSPLFAASYGKQADRDKQTNVYSQHEMVTTTNLDVFHSNFSASSERAVKAGNVDRVVQGERTVPNPRSTAQILALLNTLPSQKGSVADQLPAGVSTVYSNEIQKTISIRNAIGDTKICKTPKELSPIKMKPVKSRWDVYIDNTPASNITQTDHDDFIVPLSPDNRLDISHADCLNDNEARQEKMMGLDRKTDLGENKKPSDSHTSEPGLTNSRSLTPEALAVDADVEDNDGAFSDITFNFMDSFDLKELDDADSTESQPEGVSDLTKACADFTEKQDFLQRKSQEKHDENELLKSGRTENTSLHENITDCDITTAPELSWDVAESEPAIQTLLKNQSKMAKSGDHNNKAEVMTEANVTQIVKNREFLFPNIAEEAHIPSRQIMFHSDNISKQKALPKNLDGSFGFCRGKSSSLLANANMHHSVQGSNEDCNSPELWPSGSSISLLKSLTQPCNALESLNMFYVMSPTTTKDTSNDTQTHLERVEEQGQDYKSLIQKK